MIALLGIAAAVGGLTGPSFASVRRVTSSRPYAPLVRGSLERTLVLAAAGLAAAVVCAQVVGALSSVASYERLEYLATPVFFVVAPPVIGLAPWTAGELLSGPSARQEESFAAAIAAAYLAAAAGFGAGLVGGVPTALAAAAAFSTMVSVVTYLRVRGGC
ncbi:MAG: hypothetical protein ABR567_18285 [Myxococcales bacterium]|nr:hypothetical protein [Myxococcales bacterium]